MTVTPGYAKFNGITDYGDTQILTELENNLKQWVDWSLLSVGGWGDVVIQTPAVTDAYGGAQERLRWVDDPAYTDGQVWQGFRKDWVYESGVDFSDYNGDTKNPTNVQDSGVRVDGVFQTTGYHVCYPNGQVVFDTAISTDSVVDLNYSYRAVQVSVADNAQWWQEIQLQSMRADNIHFTQDERTGDWSIGGHNRIQLPAIVVEAVPRGFARPYEMGNASLWIEQDVVFHILADDRTTRNKLVSMLQVQADHTLWMFDSDAVTAATGFPLDYRGERINGTVYPDIVGDTDYRYKKCRFIRTEVSEVDTWHPRLYEGTVRTACELVFGNS